VKSKELESLAEAVRLENRRLRAYEAQRRSAYPYHPNGYLITVSRGEHSFTSQYSMTDVESTEGLDWKRIASKVIFFISSVSTAR
jgi:hypothetical protein